MWPRRQPIGSISLKAQTPVLAKSRPLLSKAASVSSLQLDDRLSRCDQMAVASVLESSTMREEATQHGRDGLLHAYDAECASTFAAARMTQLTDQTETHKK